MPNVVIPIAPRNPVPVPAQRSARAAAPAEGKGFAEVLKSADSPKPLDQRPQRQEPPGQAESAKPHESKAQAKPKTKPSRETAEQPPGPEQAGAPEAPEAETLPLAQAPDAEAPDTAEDTSAKQMKAPPTDAPESEDPLEMSAPGAMAMLAPEAVVQTPAVALSDANTVEADADTAELQETEQAGTDASSQLAVASKQASQPATSDSEAASSPLEKWNQDQPIAREAKGEQPDASEPELSPEKNPETATSEAARQSSNAPAKPQHKEDGHEAEPVHARRPVHEPKPADPKQATPASDSAPHAKPAEGAAAASLDALKNAATAPETSARPGEPATVAATSAPVSSIDATTSQMPLASAGAPAAPAAGQASAAPPAPPAPALPPEVRFAEQNHGNIVKSMTGELLPKGGSMQIRLDPPELGPLSIQVQVQEGVANVVFQTSDGNATHLLSHTLAQLKQSLERQGITVDKLQVQQAPKSEASQQGFSSSDQQGEAARQNSSFNEEQRRETLRRLWRKVRGEDPLDVVV